VFLAYLAMHGELRRITSMMLPAGAAIVLVIVAPWYVALYLQHGWDPIVGFFVGENLERYTSLIGPQARPFWFYLPVIVTDHLPWSLCLPGIAALWWRDRGEGSTPDSRVRTLLVLWIVVIVGFFSLSRTKQDLYIFPVAAAIAALGGDFVARALRNGAPRARWTRWLDGGLSLAAVALLIAGGGVLFLFARTASLYGVPGAALAGVLLMAGGVAVAVSLLTGGRAAAVAVLLAASVAFCWTLALRVLPGFERYKPVVPLSDRLRQHARSGDVVAHYDVALPSMVFYTGRRIEMLYERDAFLALLRSGRTVHAVLPASRHEELGDALAGTCELARQPTADVKLRAILAGEPPPAVLLISTRCGPGQRDWQPD
jgi:4-amino-4-deoxy-L-arabinose transferase-like glycosyltransferase